MIPGERVPANLCMFIDLEVGFVLELLSACCDFLPEASETWLGVRMSPFRNGTFYSD